MMHKNIQTATFGGGCFWCTEAIFQSLRGVQSVVSGYSGGQTTNPTYSQICTGMTGHAEVIQVTFDADKISYHDLVEVFMTTHDPTTLNRQGADRGTQYRSIILYHDDDQSVIAESVIAELKDHFSAPIVTEVAALEVFYPAEASHQDYYNGHMNQPYCSMVISPKLTKLRAMHADKLKVIDA